MAQRYGIYEKIRYTLSVFPEMALRACGTQPACTDAADVRRAHKQTGKSLSGL